MPRAKLLLLALLLFVGARANAAAVNFRLVDAFPGLTFDRALFAAQPPDATPRMFVVEQDGVIRIVAHPAPPVPAVAASSVFLDMRSKVSRIGNEEGLLGFAFDPDFATNRKFYVHYTAAYSKGADRNNVVSVMTASVANPDAADAASERVILTVPQPFTNHKGGWIGFGPDDKLYVALGDGGSGGDPQGNGQKLTTRLAKILRIDVHGAEPFEVPADNPFVGRGGGALPEIWAYGLRNPWRCSFDRETGDLWTGDVGQDAFEEVDRVVKGGNYGWRRREAFADFAPEQTPPADPMLDPLASYDHGEGQSITGGYVYRGTHIPSLYGAYVYADFVSGTVWTLRKKPVVSGPPLTSADVIVEELLHTSEQVASFAEDRDGEIYVCSFNGRVLRLEADELPEPEGPFPALLSELHLFADLPRLVPADGALRYDVRTALWSDGAKKDRFIVLPEGAAMTYRAEDAFDLPAGAAAVKTFTLRGRRIETRVILRTGNGFEASTYRWLDDLSDATLVTERTQVAVDGASGPQAWTLPSPADCRQCHTDVAGFLLGVKSRQLAPVRGNRDLLARWVKVGVLTGDVPPRKLRPASLPVKGRGRTEARVRSYLDANCASCHRPGSPEDGGALDLRAETALSATGMIDGAPQHGDLGIEGARIVVPGNPAASLLLRRMTVRGQGQMPPLATSVKDGSASALLARWIRRRR